MTAMIYLSCGSNDQILAFSADQLLKACVSGCVARIRELITQLPCDDVANVLNKRVCDNQHSFLYRQI